MEKKLYRSRTDKKLSGVLAGLGAYIGMDATVVRLLYVLLSVFSAGFPGLLVYIILAIVIPEEPIEPPPPVWQAPPYQAPPEPPAYENQPPRED